MSTEGATPASGPNKDFSNTTQQMQAQLAAVQKARGSKPSFAFTMMNAISNLIDLHINMQSQGLLNINVDTMYSSISSSLHQTTTFAEALQYLNSISKYLSTKQSALSAEVEKLKPQAAAGDTEAQHQLANVQIELNGTVGVQSWVNDQLTAANQENAKVQTAVNKANAAHQKVESGGTRWTAGIGTWFRNGAHRHYNTTGLCSGQWHEFEKSASVDRNEGLNILNIAGGKESQNSQNDLNMQFTMIKGFLTNTQTIDAIIDNLGKLGQSESGG